MTEKQEEIDRHEALENLLERAAESEREEDLQLSQSVEEGTIHPSIELLREYAAGLMDDEDTTIMANHIALCGSCADKVLKIQYIENAPRSVAELIVEKLLTFASELSFRAFLQFANAEMVRGSESGTQKLIHTSGEPILLTLEAPADGYITILYCCEETGEIRLVFPAPGEDPKVAAGQEIDPITDEITGPAGKHYYKIFWTKDLLFDSAIAFENDEKRLEAIDDFLDSLEDLHGEDWRVVTHEFQVGE